MALFNDILTTKGQRMMAKMLTGEVKNLEFTKLVLGDGDVKTPKEAVEVISPVCEVPIKEVILSDNNVLSVTAEFKNTDIESGFYMREKGLYISDGTEEVLAIYANAGSMAGYIEPAASGVIKKVIRSSIAFSQADNVNITLKDEGYANAADFNELVKIVDAIKDTEEITVEELREWYNGDTGIQNSEIEEMYEEDIVYDEDSGISNSDIDEMYKF